MITSLSNGGGCRYVNGYLDTLLVVGEVTLRFFKICRYSPLWFNDGLYDLSEFKYCKCVYRFGNEHSVLLSIEIDLVAAI
jgi:hypothetical protein